MKAVINTHIRIPVNELNHSEIHRIKRLCTIPNSAYVDAIQFNRWISPDVPESFFSYEMNDTHMLIQRGLLGELKSILRKKLEIVWDTALYDSVGFTWKKEMESREYQNKAVEKLTKYNTGILVAPTGSGKTNMMLKVICELQQPTLILVHRNFLVEQWKNRIKEFLGYEAGIIGGGKWKLKNITIAMIPTLYKISKTKQRKLRDRFGLIITDECHHIPANTWYTVINFFSAHFRYGCSATPSRKDRMQKRLFHSIGPVRHVISDSSIRKSGSILPVKIQVIKTDFFGHLADNRAKFNKLVSSLIKDNDRNLRIIKKIIENKYSRQIVLSDRIEHLYILNRLLQVADPSISSAIVHGSVNNRERQEIFTKIKNGSIMVLFASSIADEGLDLPELEKLHLVFPTRNPMRNRQQIGRIRRPFGNKKEAVVFDYYDVLNPTLRKQFQDRRRFYRGEGYTIIVSGHSKPKRKKIF